MALRFKRSINLFKGLRLNLNKGGIGLSFGVRGLRVGVNKNGLYTSTGIPGTGLYYYQPIKLKKQQSANTDVQLNNLLKDGFEQFEKGDYKKAAEYFKSYIDKNSNDYGIIYLYGFALFKLGKYDDAIKAISNIPENSEFYDEAMAIKAFCLQDLDDNDTAEKLLNQYMHLLKGFVLKEAYFCMGEICEAKGDFKKASEWYKKMKEINE
jgi:tetratricopeptide (TPR) repeat protein